MDAAGIDKALDAAMSSAHVVGAMIIEATNGLCLGARGIAADDDASYLTIAARSALDSNGIGAVLHRECKVLLRRGTNGIIVAVYKEKDTPDDLPGSA